MNRLTFPSVHEYFVLLLLCVSLLALIQCSEPEGITDPDPFYHGADDDPAVGGGGALLAYRSNRDSSGAFQSGIYFADTNGNHKTYTGVAGSFSRWIGDSRRLIVNGGIFDGFAFYEVDIDSSIVRSLGFGARVGVFDVSPSGDSIFYSGDPIDTIWSSAIWVYSMNDSTRSGIVGGEQPSVSKDGLKLCYVNRGINVLNLSDLSHERIHSAGMYPTWGADNSTVYFVDQGYIWSIDSARSITPIVAGQGALFVSQGSPPFLWYVSGDADNYLRIWKLDLESGEKFQVTR